MAEREYDLVIVGGGIAGLTAGLYGARYGLKTVLLERLLIGGQICSAETVENFPGFPQGLPGPELGPLLQEQATKFGMEMEMGDVSAITRDGSYWSLESFDGDYRAKAVIVAAGSTLRRLGVGGEEEFEGRGVSYCATCDGAFFADETVAVVGGGDSAMDEAITLTHYASKVILFHRGDRLDAQKALQDSVLSDPKIEVRWNTVVERILGNDQVHSVAIRDIQTGETSQVEVSGVFIFIGLDPNTESLKDLLPLDNAGHVQTNIWMETPISGIFAAGDIRQQSASQLVTAAGDGATAAIAAHRYISGRSWE